MQVTADSPMDTPLRQLFLPYNQPDIEQAEIESHRHTFIFWALSGLPLPFTGTGRETNILEMAELINQLTGNQAGIVRAEPRVWDTQKRLLASIDRAKELVGYEPQMEFECGLETTVRWFRDNWERIQRDAEFPPGSSSTVRGVVVKK